ncbi:MAG: hypothetical protein WC503_04100 [Candidatus Shapirobacteria bacterium]
MKTLNDIIKFYEHSVKQGYRNHPIDVETILILAKEIQALKTQKKDDLEERNDNLNDLLELDQIELSQAEIRIKELEGLVKEMGDALQTSQI